MKSGSLGSYARQHPRIAAVFPLTYTVDGSGIVHEGRTRDISGGGLHFETQQPDLAENVQISVSFSIRDIPVKVRGRIVGRGRATTQALHAHRLTFVEISSECQTFLAAYILRNSLDAILSKAAANPKGTSPTPTASA